MDGAAADVLDALAEANARYEERFGYIFIVCATGRSADEMLAMLRAATAERSGDRDSDRGRRAGEDYRAASTSTRVGRSGFRILGPWLPALAGRTSA